METRGLVVDDSEKGVFRYHSSCLTSPDILDLERKRIFDRCWLYLGHESEVENPGDFRRRNVAGRPLFFVRSNDGDVRVFLNTCPHRGSLVCREDAGNARVFQCFYHAWTFTVDGEFLRRPDEAGYSGGTDRSELGLRTPPRVDSYRGFYFVSFDQHIEDLSDYLGGAKEYIDLLSDQSEVGIKVSRGSNKYSVLANWKLLVENVMDGYHLLPLHKTYLEYVFDLVKQIPGQGPFSDWGQLGAVRPLGNGHVVLENPGSTGRTVAHWNPMMGEDTKEEIERIRERLVERFGEERACRIADMNHSIFIFPNLIIHDYIFTLIRVLEPSAPGSTAATTWSLAPGEHSPNLLARRLDNFISFLGPGGFATPDDVEAVESCQTGLQVGEASWCDLSRGMHREPLSVDELQMRAFWRQWHGQMMGLDKVETMDRVPVGQEA